MSQKQTIINFLKNRTTTFTVDEINAVINIVNTLEEPKKNVGEGLDKRSKEDKKNK